MNKEQEYVKGDLVRLSVITGAEVPYFRNLDGRVVTVVDWYPGHMSIRFKNGNVMGVSLREYDAVLI